MFLHVLLIFMTPFSLRQYFTGIWLFFALYGFWLVYLFVFLKGASLLDLSTVYEFIYICSCSNSFVICFLEKAISWEQRQMCCSGMCSTLTFITVIWLQATAMSEGLVVWRLLFTLPWFFIIGIIIIHRGDLLCQLVMVVSSVLTPAL